VIRYYGLGLAAVLMAGLLGCAKEPPKNSHPEEMTGELTPDETVPTQNVDEARYTIETLGRRGSSAVPEIRSRYLKDPRSRVREMAIKTLGQIARKDPEVLNDVAAIATSDPSPDGRAIAVTVLGQNRAIDQIEALFKALEDEDRTVRLRASRAVGSIIGRRYETYIDGPDDQRHAAVQRLRAKIWPLLESGTRDYLKTQADAGR